MDNQSDTLKAIADIKKIMNQSTKVLSLSGWSGVFAGVTALVGGTLASLQLSKAREVDSTHDYNDIVITIDSFTHDGIVRNLFIIAVFTLITALAGAFYFTYRKSKHLGERLWTASSVRLLEALFVPIIVGGVLCMVMVFQGMYYWLVPMSLICYGMALINTSKYTLIETKSLGYVNIVMGILSIFLVDYALTLWMLGFGVMHIAYGIYMWYKYDNNAHTLEIKK